MTLAEFLLARIAEDEEAAQAGTRGRWKLGGLDPEELGDAYWLQSADKRHLWRWYPDRVLAECEAKRRIVEHQQEWARTLHETSARYSDDQCTMYRMAMYWVLERLAEPYAGHADYPGNAE